MVGEDTILKTQSLLIPFYKLIKREFRLEMFRTFKDLRETMECTANKTQEDMRKDIRKIQIEISQLTLVT